ncbi:MAG: site-specific integrase, partial [Allobaculum sp.]|nr:site-specific integrase [Allobaculum sp.]
METDFSKDDLFWEFYEKWIEIYKRGSVRQITLNKYLMTLNWIKRIAPDLKVKELNRIRYQKIINEYAKEHERQTTMD